MDTARKRFAEACRARLGAMAAESNAALSVSTIGKLEDLMRDVDPDGRLLQEARLVMVCQRLPKQDVEILITVAMHLAAKVKD